MFDDNNLEVFRGSLKKLIQDAQVKIKYVKPSVWAEERIRITSGDKQGPLRYNVTPYAREIIDCFADDHPARKVTVQKGQQIGLSSGVLIPALAYMIENCPANTIFTVGAPDLIKKAATKLDIAFEEAKIRHLLQPQVKRKSNNKTGDTDSQKDFLGGYIMITTLNNHKNIRDFTVKYGFFDDLDQNDNESKESGDTEALIAGRFTAYKYNHKIFRISTPLLKSSSQIEPSFLKGDQRYFYIPCQVCHEFIWITFPQAYPNENQPQDSGGITFETKNGRLLKDSVGCVCQKCGGFFNDAKKSLWLPEGKWIPTVAEPLEENHYSYKISSLMAPTFMTGWTEYCQQWIEANPEGGERNEKKIQTFMNTALGETYEFEKKENTASAIMENRRDYPIGIVPDALSMADGNGRIVMLTAACDLNGLMVNNLHTTNDARLDYSIFAHSENGAIYVVTHGSIGTFIRHRKQKNLENEDRIIWTYEHNMPHSVWPVLEKILSQKFMSDTGREIPITLAGIDCGAYAKEAVYPFLEMTNTPCVGLKGANDDEDFVQIGKDRKLFKQSLERGDDMYILAVNDIKDEVSRRQGLKWDKAQGQPPYFMNFPQTGNYKCPVMEEYYQKMGVMYFGDTLFGLDNYFIHFEAEVKKLMRGKNGKEFFRWEKKQSTAENHQFDNCVYNTILPDIAIARFAKQFKVKDFTYREFAELIISHIR